MPQACFFIEYILKYIFNVIIDVSENNIETTESNRCVKVCI